MIEPVLPIVDLVLIMTVNPGFGGQIFLTSQLTKIQRARALIDQTKRDILLQVDGGISPQTAPSVIQAGADILVAGSAIFNSTAAHYSQNIQMLRGIHE
jgi:ribulose-phosphate 3-epimerase